MKSTKHSQIWFLITLAAILFFTLSIVFRKFFQQNDNYLSKINTENNAINKYNKYYSFHRNLLDYLNSNDQLSIENREILYFDDSKECYFGPHEIVKILPERKFLVCSSFPTPLIALYSEDGSLIRKIGRKGQGPGEYFAPQSISICNNYLFCYDIENLKIIKYDLSGNFQNEFRLTGKAYVDEFDIVPYGNIPISYNVYSDKKLHIFTIYNNLSENSNKPVILQPLIEVGEMAPQNMVARNFLTCGLDVNEDSLVFCCEPVRFGFYVYDYRGNKLLSSFKENIKGINLLKNINKKEIDTYGNDRTWRDLFVKHSRFRFLHYLGRGVIGISIENSKSQFDKKIPFFYSFWRIDGTYLGMLNLNGKRIRNAQNGKLIAFQEEQEMNEDGFFGNPGIVIIDLWKEVDNFIREKNAKK